MSSSLRGSRAFNALQLNNVTINSLSMHLNSVNLSQICQSKLVNKREKSWMIKQLISRKSMAITVD